MTTRNVTLTTYECDLCGWIHQPDEAEDLLHTFIVVENFAERDGRHYVHTSLRLEPDNPKGRPVKHLCETCILGIHNFWVKQGQDVYLDNYQIDQDADD